MTVFIVLKDSLNLLILTNILVQFKIIYVEIKMLIVILC